jgi:hypothetical protein
LLRLRGGALPPDESLLVLLSLLLLSLLVSLLLLLVPLLLLVSELEEPAKARQHNAKQRWRKFRLHTSASAYSASL